MKFLLALLISLPSAQLAHAKLVRVFYRPDGSLAIMVPICHADETEHGCLSRALANVCRKNPAQCAHEQDTVDESTLPPRSKRNQWRGQKGRQPFVDDKADPRRAIP